LKKLWLHIVRFYIRLGLFFYYKTIKVINASTIPDNKPILFLSNHQNALMDALLIATTCGRFSYFLTRASAFNNPIISKVLNSLQMYPVYRIRDGWGNLTNNNPIFDICTDLLKNNKSVVIFPEGDHNLKRTVRPLSKGFTRIVFDALEKFPNIDLQLLPVGLNFVHANRFGDSCSVHYGYPINANSFVGEERNQAINDLRDAIHDRLCKLTTHIEEDQYENTLQRLNKSEADFLDPQAVNTCISNNFLECDFQRKKTIPILKAFLKGLLLVNLVVPYAIWKLFIEPKIDEEEFLSTFRFSVAISLVPIWILTLVIILTSVYGLTVGLGYLLFVLSVALLAVKT